MISFDLEFFFDSPQPVFYLDCNFSTLKSNKLFAKMLAVDNSPSLIHVNPRKTDWNKYFNQSWEKIRNTIANNHQIRLQTQIGNFSGRTFQFIIVKDNQGFLLTGSEITDLQKKAMDIGERQYFQYGGNSFEDNAKIIQSVVDAFPVGLGLVRKGGIKWANPALETITSYSKQELQGLSFAELFVKQSVDLLEYDQEEVVWKTKAGDRTDVMLSSKFVDTEGEEKSFIFIVQDISVRLKFEHQQALLEKQLQQAQKMESLGTLAGGIAHDLNNILTPVMWHTASMSQKEKLEQKDKKRLQSIDASIIRAKDLIANILTFARPAKNKQKKVNLSKSIEEALSFLWSSIPGNIEVVKNIEQVFPIWADPTQINQILVNICTNAQHAMEENGGVLEISCKNTFYKNKYWVEVVISDTGTGIKDEIIKNIFEPFFTTKAVDKGSGLGLSVVHGIMKRLQGEIKLRSKVDRGSEFTFLFPRWEKEKLMPATQDETFYIGNREKILIVDDEKEITDVLAEALSDFRYCPVVCNNADSALNKLKDDPKSFSLIVTDHAMPMKLGLEMIEEIKRINSKVPIMVITSYPQLVEKSKLQQYDLLFAKPVVPLDFNHAVHDLIKGRKARGEQIRRD
ncbi:MAG: ATP-binding protein [Deltaproteobacteria bacterium]|nr:ATP-binding protein [Deltaproteobacteria bacterium]